MKKLLILLSLSALVFGCSKDKDAYKANISEWHPTVPEEKPEEPEEEHEYTLEELGTDANGPYILYQLVDHFIQGYMTATSIAVEGSDNPYYNLCFIRLYPDGPTVCGGPYKSDPCDPGFNELADRHDGVYGPYDAVTQIDVEDKIMMILNNIKYDLYVVGSDYDEEHPDGSSLNDIAKYYFGRKISKRPFKGKWTETVVSQQTYYPNLVEYNRSDETLVAMSRTRVRNSLVIPYPAQAGTYSFRLVATSGGEVICDKTIENVELPARKQ